MVCRLHDGDDDDNNDNGDGEADDDPHLHAEVSALYSGSKERSAVRCAGSGVLRRRVLTFMSFHLRRAGERQND